MKIIVLTLFIVTAIQASAQFSISGKISDEKQKPARSASVLLLRQKDSSLLVSSLSDQDGAFVFKNVKGGNYFVCISMINYKKKFVKVNIENNDIQLNTIKLVFDEHVLEDVTVTARKPFLEQRADKLIVNVEASATAAGSTALEILQKVPGVLVINDKVTMVGKGTPAIMIDGRLSQYTDIEQVLRDMSASNIEKIEVISNPGAKYDASGGAVINIILKRNADLGTNGNINLSTGMGLYDTASAHTDRNFYRIGPSINLNHRKGKLNIYGGYGFFHRNQFEYNELSRVIAPNIFFQTNYQPNDVNSNTYRAGADFYADKKNTFGIALRGFARNGSEDAVNKTQQLSASTGALISSFQTFNTTQNKRINNSANLNWKHNFDTTGKDLNIDLDYSAFQLNTASDIVTQLSNNSKSVNNQFIDNPVHFLVLKADYSMPVNKDDKFEMGAKSSFATINNYLVFKQNGVTDITRSTDFQYTENINAVYTSFQKKFKNWDVQAGLRVEQTVATGTSASKEVLSRDYWQLFPSFFLTRKISKQLAGVLQYSRRVNRPSYQQQNPFIEYLDSLTYEQGNPLLLPETADEYKFSLTYENQPFFSISYNKKYDVIINNAPKQNGNITYTTSENLASFENVAFELNFPLDFGKKISGYGGNQAIYNHYKANYLGATYDRSQWNWLAYWQVSYKPTPMWNFEVSGFYMTKQLNEFLLLNDMGSLNFAMQHFLWEKKGRISLNFNDLLFSQKTNATIAYQAIDVRFRQWNESRNVRFTFTYSFGNQKLKAVRSRATASDAEANRVKTN